MTTPTVLSVSLSANGRRALTGHADNKVALWAFDLDVGKRATPFHLCATETVSHMHVAEGAYLSALSKAEAAFARAEFTHAARWIREARRQPGRARQPGAVSMWYKLYRYLPRSSLNDAWARAPLEGHMGGVTTVCMSKDCQYALSGSRDKTVRYWDLRTGQCLRVLKGHRDTVHSVVLTVDCEYAVSGDHGNSRRLWDLGAGTCVRGFSGYDSKRWAAPVCVTDDGNYVLSGAGLILGLWEFATGRPLRAIRVGRKGDLGFPFTIAAYSQWGRLFLSASVGMVDSPLWPALTITFGSTISRRNDACEC